MRDCETLNLTRTDIEAVADYIHQHVRSSPTGRGYKVWLKMHEFLNGNTDSETPMVGEAGEGQWGLF